MDVGRELPLAHVCRDHILEFSPPVFFFPGIPSYGVGTQESLDKWEEEAHMMGRRAHEVGKEAHSRGKSYMLRDRSLGSRMTWWGQPAKHQWSNPFSSSQPIGDPTNEKTSTICLPYNL